MKKTIKTLLAFTCLGTLLFGVAAGAGCSHTHADENVDGVCEICSKKIDDIYDETENVYRVYTAKGLYAWAEYTVSKGYTKTGLILMRDIVMPTEMNFDLDGDAKKESNWKPIDLSGTVDGNGHSITGITVTESTERCGFLSYLHKDGAVKNLTLKNVRLEGNVVGGVVGENYGTITNCAVDGTLRSNDVAGGIVYTNLGKVVACHNAAEIFGSGVGGIAYQINDENAVIACYNTGAVASTTDSYGPSAGGIVASFFGGNVTACYNTATVSAISDTADVGGVIGYFHKEGATLSANYWSTTGDTPTQGEGRNEANENTLRVDGETIDWEAALIAMNAALEAADSEWRYVVNTGADAAARPLVLTKTGA